MGVVGSLSVHGRQQKSCDGVLACGAVALAFGFAGIAVYFASNQALAMLSLSGRYAAATANAQRSMFLAAGEALLAINNPGAIYQGTGIYLSLLLVLLAGLIISIVMRPALYSTTQPLT